MGGLTSGTSFEEYNVSTNSWKSLADMSTPREFISGCEINGKIYAIGGINAPSYPESGQFFQSLSVVEEYDPLNNSWKQKTSMPTAR